MTHRKVEMDELFYDLVFAYAISNLTGLLENTFESKLSLFTGAVYLLSFVVMVNSWMYQTVYTNRYGKKGFLHSVLILMQTAILLFLSSALASPSENIFVPFTLALGGLSFLLFLEYLLSYFKADSTGDRQLIRIFLIMIGIRTILIVLGTCFPVRIGVWISISGVILGWILPLFFRKRMKTRPVDFSHLSERLSLLVILMFGEMIISLAGLFTPQTFGLYSLTVFLICALLFQSYTLFYTHFQTGSNKTLTGVKAIYMHYLILIGLNLVTVSISALRENTFFLYQLSSILMLGLLMFYSGLYGCISYLEEKDRNSLKHMWACLLVFIAVWALSVFLNSSLIISILTLAGVAIQYGILYRHFHFD